MDAQDLPAAGAAGFHGAIRVEDDLPAPSVNTDVMVIVAEQATVLDRGFTAVPLVAQVAHIAGGTVAGRSRRSCAVLVAEDDGAADVRRDGV